jgi:C-terminal processing protease CtpA/Prc
MKNPILKLGYFDDQINSGSEAEINFEKEQKFVEWRTREGAILDTRKTYILINSNSGSSSDIFAAAIKEHKAAMLVGTRTRGAVLGGEAYKLLWRGYTAIFPFSQIISPTGKLYEGVGVAPDYELKSCDENTDVCLSEVINLIHNKKI